MHQVAKNIARYGWHVTGVFDSKSDEPSFAYTVGATTRNLPELIIVGLDPRTGCMLINDLLHRLQEGTEIIKEDEPYNELANVPMYLRKLTPPQMGEHMTMCLHYHGTTPFDAYQLVYPDPDGTFPWEPDYDFPQQTLLFER